MNTLTIYSTATCGFCHMLKKFLDDHGIGYQSKMADENPEFARELHERSGQLGVPFSVIENEKGEVLESVLGFDVQKFNRLIQDGVLQKD